MLNIFKKQKTVSLAKTTNELIEEIHESFYTEVDKLLKEANILNSLDTNKADIIEKHKRLKALGFTNTTEFNEATGEIKRLDKLSKDNEYKNDLVEAINYFSSKYPNYKFITEESVKKICSKYNLIYSTVNNYIGSVPDENLKHIEEFKVDKKDECYLYAERTWWKSSFRMGKPLSKVISYNEYKTFDSKLKVEHHDIYNKHITVEKLPLEIAAPLKDFDTENMEVKDFKLSKIEIPDPVVLKPVQFKGQKHYLIVTAWGIEASDELVVNQRLN